MAIFCLIDLRKFCQLGDRGRNVLVQFGIFEGIADVAAVQGVLVRVFVIKIRCDADETIAREPLGKVERVFHQAITLVHEHDGGDLAAANRQRKKGRQAGRTVNIPSDDFSHVSTPILRRCSL